MEKIAAVLATMAVGALIAFQPPLNAQLAKSTGVLGAAFVSTGLSAVVVGLVVLVSGKMGDALSLGGVSPAYLAGGLLGAALVTVSLITVRTLGAGGVVAATVAAQLAVSAILDRLGVLGLEPIGLSPHRLFGFALLFAGTALVTLR
jgi:transporter family-2 protein